MAALFDGGQEVPAGLLTASAGLGADPAVLMVLGMPLALIAAALADRCAGLQQRLGDVGVVLHPAGGNPDGGGADIGAVQAQPDAPDHLGHVVLAQIGVDVGSASLGAIVEGVDGSDQHVGVDADGAWVSVHHLPGVAHGPSFEAMPQRHPITRSARSTSEVNPGSSLAQGSPATFPA